MIDIKRGGGCVYTLERSNKVEVESLVEDRNLLGVKHWVIKPKAHVELVDGLDVFLIHLPVESFKVHLHAFWVQGLGHHRNIALKRPAKSNLGRWPVVLGGNFLDDRVFKEGLHRLGTLGTSSDKGSRAEGRVSGDGDALGLDPLDQILLLKVRVQLDLEKGWLDLGVGEHVHQQLDVKVRDTNVADKAGFDELFHFGPAFVHRGTVQGDLIFTGLIPAGRILLFDRDIL